MVEVLSTMQKSGWYKGDGTCQGGHLNKMGGAGLFEKKTLEPNPEGGEGVSYVGIGEEYSMKTE